MELSTTKQKEAKKYGVPVQFLLMSDLMSLGYSEADAYTVAYPENSVLSVQRNRGVRENIVTSPKFKKLLETRIQRTNATHAPAEGELLDKRQTAQLIMSAAMRQPSDSKERIEGLMKYSDLMGYKKDEVEDDSTDNITFFLPLKCSQCPLLKDFNAQRSKDGKSEVRYVEMERIISREEDR